MEKRTKIAEIAAQEKEIQELKIDDFIECYKEDERSGVKKIINRAQKRKEAYLAEIDRIKRMKEFENSFGDYQYLCGVDEAGRGPLAGPVVAGAVILPKDCELLYINDSKQLSESRRKELFQRIKEEALSWAVGIADHKRIDEINILQADYEAMRQAVGKIHPTPELLLNDAVILPGIEISQKSIIKGDAKSYSIAAASILAKVTRDGIMEEYDRLYPEYGFAKNKGYGTKDHRDALKKYGPCPIHRQTFIKKVMQ